MGSSTRLLMNPVEEWGYDEGYVRTAGALREFKVSNEDAERGVKLVADNLGLSKMGRHLAKLLASGRGSPIFGKVLENVPTTLIK